MGSGNGRVRSKGGARTRQVNEALLRALLTVATGAVAGGLTNTLAIWMLFHPYAPPSLGGRRLRFLQGAIPKNQPRLAAAIGRTVGTRLLTEEDLAAVVALPEFREAFDARLAKFWHDVLEEERGSLQDVFGAEAIAEIAPVAREALEHLLARLQDYVQSERFTEDAAGWAQDLAAFAAEQRVAGLLTPDREAKAVETVREWIDAAVAGRGFRRTVEGYVRRAADRLLDPRLAIRDVLPAGAAGPLERAVAGFLPLAIRRLGSMLEDAEAKRRFEKAVNEVLRRFLQDLKFHQRVVARLVMNEDTVNRAVDAIQVEGADRIAEMLRDPPVQDAMAKGIGDAIADLMDRPVAQVFGDPDGVAATDAQAAVVEWVIGLAGDATTRAFVLEKLEAGVARASERTWGELLGGVPPERLAGWLVSAARSEVAADICRDGAVRLAKAAAERPIGRPARLLPPGASQDIPRALGDPLWTWLQGQVPPLVRRLDVAHRVEQKVMDYPVDRMEELVRRVTHRELKTIVRLGYALGAFIGLALVAVNYLIG